MFYIFEIVILIMIKVKNITLKLILDVNVIRECKNKSRLWKPLVQWVWKETKQEKSDKREKTEF